MGRDEDRQIETIIYKPEWKEGEEKEMLRWLQDDRSKRLSLLSYRRL